MAEEEKKEEEEAAPDWLSEVLVEAEQKREESPSFQPPPVSQKENDYLSISEEARERKFRRVNYLLIFLVVIQIIALILVIVWP